MFTFGYSHEPPYVTYRVISKDGAMHDPVPITISDPIMMHDFAITENYAVFLDLPLYFRPKVQYLSYCSLWTQFIILIKQMNERFTRFSMIHHACI
jgi:carotenoid cleavage dioxygenase-like enzyme